MGRKNNFQVVVKEGDSNYAAARLNSTRKAITIEVKQRINGKLTHTLDVMGDISTTPEGKECIFIHTLTYRDGKPWEHKNLIMEETEATCQ
jgi:hypothetical protein